MPVKGQSLPICEEWIALVTQTFRILFFSDYVAQMLQGRAVTAQKAALMHLQKKNNLKSYRNSNSLHSC